MNYKAIWSKHWFVILSGVILILATVLRVWNLGKVPVGLYWDEIAMLLDARSIAQTGRDMRGDALSLILPSYGDYKLPVYVWLSAPITFLPIPPEAQIRLVSTLAGIATVILLGILTRELFEKKTIREQKIACVAVMFVAAILPWSIHFSHAGFEGHLGQLWVLSSVLGILIARKKPWLLLLVGVLGVAGLLTYYSVRFVWPVVAIASWMYVWWNYKPKRWLVFGIVMLLIFATAWFQLTKDPHYTASEVFRLSGENLLNTDKYVLQQNVYREQAGNGRLERLFFHRYLLQLADLLANMGSHLSPVYVFVNGDENLRHGTTLTGLGYLTMFPLLLLGIVSLWRKHRFALAFLAVWWLVALVPASVPYNAPHALRSLNALAPFALLIGFGLASVWLWRHRLAKFVRIGVVALLVLHTMYYTYIFHTIYPVISAGYWQDGYAQIAREVYAQRKGVEETFINLEQLFFLWYLVYSDISISEIQNLPWNGFLLSQLSENTTIEAPHIPSRFHDGRTYLYVSRESNVADMLKLVQDEDTEILFDSVVSSREGAYLYRIVKFIK